MGDSFSRDTACLLAHIAQTIVASWANPSDGIMQVYWALYQDMFGPGEILGTRPIIVLCGGMSVQASGSALLGDVQICQGWVTQAKVSMCACRLTQCHCYQKTRMLSCTCFGRDL